MKIYLDVDGVLLTKNGLPARFLEKFLDSITENHEVYWLTTHCQGEARTALDYLKSHGVSTKTLEIATKIKPTRFDILKTEAIDMESEFKWFEDSPLISELEVLTKNNKNESFVLIDLVKDPNQLKKHALSNQ